MGSTTSAGNYPSASDLISISNSQCTCKKVIVRLGPSLFVISPSRRWKREFFLKQKAFRLIAVCECKHEKQHNLFPSFSGGIKYTSHCHWQIVFSTLYSTAGMCVHTRTHILQLKRHIHRNYGNLCCHGMVESSFLILSGRNFKPSTISSTPLLLPPSLPLRFGWWSRLCVPKLSPSSSAIALMHFSKGLWHECQKHIASHSSIQHTVSSLFLLCHVFFAVPKSL